MRVDPERDPGPPRRPNRVWVVLRSALVAVGGVVVLAALVAGTLEFVLRRDDARAGRTLASYGYGAPGQRQGMYEPHPFLGYALRPGFVRERDPAIAGSAQIAINAFGMRGREIDAVKPPGVVRIVCIGGSTTFCTGAMSDAETWPARLEERLAAAGAKVEVLNCGVPGWNTVEGLINLALRVVELDPDIALLYDIPNDARAIQMRGFLPDYAHLRRAWVDERPGPLEEWLGGHSHLYARIRQSLAPAEQGGNTLQRRVFTEGFKSRHIRSDVEVPEEGIRVFVRNLEAILALAAQHDILPVLKTFADSPGTPAPDGERYTETIQRQNAEIVALAQRAGVPWIDVTPLRGRAVLFDDWMHYNGRGCDEHAALVARAMLAMPAVRARLDLADGE